MGNQNQGFSIEEVMQLIKSPVGQQLVKVLQSSDDPALQKVKQHAAGGDLSAAKDALQHFTANEEIQKLLSQLGG